jgi:signal transduction histidine kinase
MVEELLDVTQFEHGDIALARQDFDLAPALRDVLETWRARPGGEHLVDDVPDHLAVHADPQRVRQVVSNLVENAFKYAPESEIVLHARAAGESVRVEVQDRGPGIPQEEQQRIWERLYRGQGVAGRNVARGSGIGLAVVKALVEAQGGRVGVESAPGLGSRFWFELPAAEELPRAIPPAS